MIIVIKHACLGDLSNQIQHDVGTKHAITIRVGIKFRPSRNMSKRDQAKLFNCPFHHVRYPSKKKSDSFSAPTTYLLGSASMRTSVAILLASIASAFAYEVTSPGDSEGWTTAGPNVLTWQRVDTDPANFTAVLTNVNYGVMNPQVLNALVDGTLGSIVCNAPSGGWPVGAGFRVNLAADAQHLDTLLAQSNQFNITSGSSTSTSTGSGAKTTTTSLFSGTTGTIPSTAVAASTTSSDTSTTPTGSSAAILGMKVETGFLTAVAACVAFITTHF
ncbi:uncharacterized protein F5891DRAFT_999742 [Suillus fuscotomentosus]|uniref:Uncharacterized protein n=1 Tax=Suillus fuscotomentosus TaxID=1912939 RepID=A0AAD4EIT4_9AGAM|nr:uncharacterized protein F5891DRAFT_999742 [Suillus fuscotomentosus]KAG1907000.1 hypothetical protein F5891DRAFT_999742 [Suillus fuscotomentosus]